MARENEKMKKERAGTLALVPENIRDMFGQIGFAKPKRVMFPVLIMNPYDVSDEGVREMWHSAFEKCKEGNRLENTPYVVYWYGRSGAGQNYSLLPQKKFFPYFKEKAKGSRGVHQLPARIQKLIDSGTALKGDDKCLAQAYNEMEEDLPKVPGKRKRGIVDVVKCCDICSGEDGKLGMILQTCKTCGVSVHNECYISGNAANLAPDPDFECWACQAVGKAVKVRNRDKNGQRIAVKVGERPTECCLCSVDDGKESLHAMHPVYDDWGDRGRQILLPKTQTKPPRLAWAHTACALCIGAHEATKGCVYGCGIDGHYEGCEDEDPASDTESVNSDLGNTTKLPAWTAGSAIHHYVYCLKKPGQPDDDWTRTIREQQNDLTCQVCGSTDPGTYRIPLQCCANDENEPEEFRRCHKDLQGDETCYVPVHVGCAMWRQDASGERPAVQRFFYFPAGKNDEHTEPAVSLYCLAHALDMADNLKDLAEIDGSSESEDIEEIDTDAEKSHNINVEQAGLHKIYSVLAGTSSGAPAVGQKRKAVELPVDSQKSNRRFSGTECNTEIYNTMVADLVKHLEPIPVFNSEKINCTRMDRRHHWQHKLETANITPDMFRDVWSKVSMEADEELRSARESARKLDAVGMLPNEETNEEGSNADKSSSSMPSALGHKVKKRAEGVKLGDSHATERGNNSSGKQASAKVKMSWNDRFEQLKRYREQHGDFNVPKNYPPDKSFGYWVSNLRGQRSRKLRGNDRLLTDEREAKLNSIGFNWVATGHSKRATTMPSDEVQADQQSLRHRNESLSLSEDTEDDGLRTSSELSDVSTETEVEDILNIARQKKLLREIVKEISQKERNDRDHLETILKHVETEQRMKLNLDEASFRRLWYQVERFVSEKLGYSAIPTDWDNGWDRTCWDTIKVLPAKPQANDGAAKR